MGATRISPRGCRAGEQIAAISAAKLRETNRLLTIAEGLADFGHWRVDPDEQEVERSAQACVILGVPPHQSLTPRGALRLIHAEDRRKLLRVVARATAGGPAASCRVRLHQPDGKLRHVVVQVQSDSRPGERSAGLLGVVRDITKLVAAEERLIAARDDAQAATNAKSDFLATMSHEIRTPMTGVMGMIDLLRSSPTAEERDRYLAAMQQSAELLMAVLDGILDFSKVESGKLELDCKDFDLAALARGTVDMFANSASKKGLSLDLSIETSGSTLVHGDPIRIQQVMSNLVSNALKFTNRGRVSLSLRARDRSPGRQVWRVSVKDTGTGIAAAEIQHLFEPFVQAGDRRCGGTGLGLAISRRLVEIMGGRAGVRSTHGRGSTFWFEIELPVAIACDSTIEGDVTEPGSGEPLHVLVAEDNLINQMLIAALVRRLGHRVTCVDHGRRALEAAQAVPFDCILIDMQMPEMDGVAATRAIRSSEGPNRDVPIIALTADAAPERRRFYDNVGLTDFMTKPLTIESLRRHLAPIARLPARSAELPQAPAVSGPALDPEHIADVRNVLSPAKFETLLQMLRSELATRPAAMRLSAVEGDLETVRRQAHSLKGAVASFGATGVARAAKAVELALPGAELELALQRLEGEAALASDAVCELLDVHSTRPRKTA